MRVPNIVTEQLDRQVVQHGSVRTGCVLASGTIGDIKGVELTLGLLEAAACPEVVDLDVRVRDVD